MIKRRKFPRIFFGWWTVLVGTYLNFWHSAFSVYGFSALFKPLSSELGFTRAATSVASSISRFEGGFLAPLTGWLSDKFGPKWLIILGIFFFSSSLILMYYINSLWAFYIVWGGLLGLGGSVSMVPMAKAITNWFVKKRGLAMSIRAVASGILILSLIAWSIETQGWRMTCLLGGIIGGLIGLPLAWFGVKMHRPEYYGLLPDGATMEEESTEAGQMIDKGVKYAAEAEEIEFTLRQATRTPTFWMLIVGQAGYMGAHQALAIHLIPFLTDMGIDLTRAAIIITFSGMIGIGARLLSGFVADRLKKGQLRILLGGAILLQGMGITIFLLNPIIIMTYPFLILNYIGFGISMILAPLTWARYFGRKAFGSIRGISALAPMPLVLFSPIYTGWVFDTTGSYTTAFITLAAIFTSAAVLMFLARPPKPPAQVTDIRQIL
ncbi:MFS transporter [Chloroflexota bacterium]